MRPRAPAALLAAAGAVAVAAALGAAPWYAAEFLVLFGALDQLEGPFGLGFGAREHLRPLAGGLGALAVAVGALAALRGVRRWVAATAGLACLLGAVDLGAWLLDPPGSGAVPVERSLGFGTGAHVAAAALLVAAGSGLALASPARPSRAAARGPTSR